MLTFQLRTVPLETTNIFTGKKTRTVRKQHLWDPRPVLCVDVGPSPWPQCLSVHFLLFSSVMEKGGWKGAFAHVCAHSHSITGLCSFPIAVVTECCKFSSLKQSLPIISMGQNPGTASVCVPLVFCLESQWMKSGLCSWLGALGQIRFQGHSGEFPVSTLAGSWGGPQGLDAPTPWLLAPCLPLQSQQWGGAPLSLRPSLSPPPATSHSSAPFL